MLQATNAPIMFAVLVTLMFLLTIIGLATLVIVARLYKMHDVKNSDGQLAWMVPSNYAEMAKKLNESQQLIVVSLKELSCHNAQTAELIKSSINALLEMRQDINRIK